MGFSVSSDPITGFFFRLVPSSDLLQSFNITVSAEGYVTTTKRIAIYPNQTNIPIVKVKLQREDSWFTILIIAFFANVALLLAAMFCLLLVIVFVQFPMIVKMVKHKFCYYYEVDD